MIHGVNELEGKTVLILHRFIDSIKCQIEKDEVREKIFPGTKILPKFKAKYVKAFQ